MERTTKTNTKTSSYRNRPFSEKGLLGQTTALHKMYNDAAMTGIARIACTIAIMACAGVLVGTMIANRMDLMPFRKYALCQFTSLGLGITIYSLRCGIVRRADRIESNIRFARKAMLDKQRDAVDRAARRACGDPFTQEPGQDMAPAQDDGKKALPAFCAR